MASKLHPISDAEWEQLTAGMEDTSLSPDDVEAVRRFDARVAAGETFLSTSERATLDPQRQPA